MPTECPGRGMTANEDDFVQAGDLDYAGGKWLLTELGQTRRRLTAVSWDESGAPRCSRYVATN